MSAEVQKKSGEAARPETEPVATIESTGPYAQTARRGRHLAVNAKCLRKRERLQSPSERPRMWFTLLSASLLRCCTSSIARSSWSIKPSSRASTASRWAIIKEQPQEIYNQAKFKVLGTVKPYTEKLCELWQTSQQKAVSLKELSWKKTNDILASQYGSIAVNSVDTHAQLAERLLDYFFPK